MNHGVIIAARMGSSRLPGKAMLPIKGMPLITFLMRRLQTSVLAEKIILATTELARDDVLVDAARGEGIEVYRGSAEDVVDRYVSAAEHFGFEYVTRVTGDCPFVQGETLDYCLKKCDSFGNFDLATTKGYFPKGIDYEIYSAAVMKKLHQGSRLNSSDREHLTLYMYDHNNDFIIKPVVPLKEWMCSTRHFTIDTREDYEYCASLAERFDTIHFSIFDIVCSVLHEG